MKMKFLIIVFSLTSFWVNAQTIEWMTFREALDAQRENPKKIIVDVYTDWCGKRFKIHKKYRYCSPY